MLFVILFIGGLLLFIKFCGMMSSSTSKTSATSNNNFSSKTDGYVVCTNCSQNNFIQRVINGRCKKCGHKLNQTKNEPRLSSGSNTNKKSTGIDTISQEMAASNEILTTQRINQRIDQNKLTLIKNEVTRAANEMQSHRSDNPFTDLEKALGYSAFINWLGTYMQMKKDNDSSYEEFYLACNESARMISISVMKHLYEDEAYSNKLLQKVPNTNAIKEIDLAMKSTFDTYWEQSTTRAVLMICRQLAYFYTGALGEADFRIVGNGIDWDDLTNAVDV